MRLRRSDCHRYFSHSVRRLAVSGSAPGRNLSLQSNLARSLGGIEMQAAAVSIASDRGELIASCMPQITEHAKCFRKKPRTLLTNKVFFQLF